MNYNISRLRNILIEELKDYPGEPVLLPFDNSLLKKILFDYNYYYSTFSTSISEILTKINYANVDFRGFRAINFDFSPYTGIKINPTEVYEKDLSDTICAGVEFIGTFAGVDVRGANFKGSKGAKIDPQSIQKKSLENTICADVEFIGIFVGVDVGGANFKGSKGAKINPQKVAQLDLRNTICADVEFIGDSGREPNFDGVNIEAADFTGSNYEETIKFENEFREKIKLMTNGNVYVK